MLTKSILTRLQYQHESITNLISGKEDKIRLFPQPGKWSIHDNIAHLAKYQNVFMERLSLMQNEINPVFERYIAENDQDFESWRKKETIDLLKIISDDRKEIFDRIKSFNKEELKRTGSHRKFGKMTVIDWTEFFLLHEAHHIYTIFQLAKSI